MREKELHSSLTLAGHRARWKAFCNLAKRRALFLRALQEAVTTTGSQTGAAVATFLTDEQAVACCIADLQEKGYAGNDLFTFDVDGDLLHEDEALRRWWTGPSLSTAPVNPKNTRQCLLCGEQRTPVDKHNSLLVPGGVTSGVALVTFNSAVFEKYGLERNDNAPICRECMTAYVEGLRRLMNSRYISTQRSDFRPQNTRLSGDTTAVYWSNVDDALPGILGELLYSPQQVRDVLLSPHRGQRSQPQSARFFCLILSGAQGRAMLRSMHTGTLADLACSLSQYFGAIQIEGRDENRPIPLQHLLASLIHQKKKGNRDDGYERKLDKLPPKLAGEVFLGILFGTPMPRLLLSAAVERNRAEQRVPAERAALLQVYFQSLKQTGVPRMSLDESSPLPAYRLGRLLAVFEKAQQDKVRMDNPNAKLNRTIVDRSFGAASTRPGTVFPQLVRLSQTHLSRLGDKANYLQKWIGEITDGLSSFSPMLTLEEQGHFALGYYHQRQRFFRKRDLDDAPTPENPDDIQTEGAIAE